MNQNEKCNVLHRLINDASVNSRIRHQQGLRDWNEASSDDDTESSSEDDEDGAKKKKKPERIEESERDWDESSKEEEETGSGSFTFDSGCGFRKLDAFDACEQLQNDESRSAGIEFIDEKIKKEQWIAVNVIDEYLINKCKKNCRQRITIKLKALLRSGALDKRQGSIDSSHSSVVLFNMNHSVYAYLAE
eukprot:982113_1